MRTFPTIHPFRLFTIWTIFLIGILVTGNLYVLTWRPQLSEIFERDVPQCPVVHARSGSENRSVRSAAMTLFAFGKYGDIRFSTASHDGASCTITVAKPPLERHANADWRIGIVLPDPVQYRGRSIDVVLVLRTDRSMSLPMASFYIHDGASGSGRPLPPTQGNAEVTISLSHTVSDEATSVEIWLRLVAPSGGDIDSGRIEIVRLEISESDPPVEAR